MVNLHFLFDIFLFFTISFLIYYSYQNKIYVKIFEYFKLFIMITVSAKFASMTGIGLELFHIISADTYITIVLIGFGVNIILIYSSERIIFKFLNKFINSGSLKIFFAKLITVIEVVILSSFTLYIFMQLSFSKSYIYPTLKNSYSYPYIRSFYIKFLTDDFLNMLLKSDTGTNYKEIIFKSFKNTF